MSAEGAAVIRPRTTGELLDDAWRLVIADAPALLLLSGAFLAPAFAAFVLLAGLPAPANPALRLLPPLVPLILFVLTGVGSGACQEWLRACAETRKPSLAGCLVAAFRLGLPHSAARALALVGPLLGLGVWLSMVGLTEKPGGTADGWLLLWRLLITAVACLPGLLLWPFTATIHAFLASGKTRTSADLGEYFRQLGADTGKSGVTTLTRTALLLLVIVNLVLLVKVGLWILDGLAGLDAAFVGLQLSIANPIYDLALVLFAWLLLAPFFEASNFLLYVDGRSRHEGLDLQVRVQRVFPTTERRRVGALAVLVGLLWLAAPARADTTYDAVHAARQDVQTVRRKAEAQDPYRGAPWQDRARSDGRPPGASGRPSTVRLVPQSDRRFRRPAEGRRPPRPGRSGPASRPPGGSAAAWQRDSPGDAERRLQEAAAAVGRTTAGRAAGGRHGPEKGRRRERQEGRRQERRQEGRAGRPTRPSGADGSGLLSLVAVRSD